MSANAPRGGSKAAPCPLCAHQQQLCDYSAEDKARIACLKTERDELLAERNRLQHIVHCADTPLMRDVMAERDRLREALDHITWVNDKLPYATHDWERTATLMRDIARSALDR